MITCKCKKCKKRMWFTKKEYCENCEYWYERHSERAAFENSLLNSTMNKNTREIKKTQKEQDRRIDNSNIDDIFFASTLIDMSGLDSSSKNSSKNESNYSSGYDNNHSSSSSDSSSSSSSHSSYSSSCDSSSSSSSGE